MISALPRSESAGPVLGALTGLQAWAALTLVPWWLDRGRGVPALAVVNGQFLALRASAYDRSGGFAAVRDSLAEDTLLGRRLVTPRRLADRRAGQGWTVTLLHPLAVVAQAAMMVASWRRLRGGGTVEWRGRRYHVGT